MMRYRREIDGLRALAVLSVMFFHAGFPIFRGGFVGVDIFFVISGYLITSIILADQQAGTFSLFNFYERRARRILPALFFVMLVCLPFVWQWFLPSDMKAFSQSLIAVPLFVSNISFYLTGGYFQVANELQPLLHTWSLGVEEQYYMLFPLFLILTGKLSKKKTIWILVAVSLLSLAAAQIMVRAHPSFTFYLLPTRAWEILMGALLAFYLLNKEHVQSQYSQAVYQFYSLIGLLLIMCAIGMFHKKTPFPSLHALVPTVGTVCIILFARPSTIVGKLLGSNFLVSIGLISYSAYLWHQPLFAFLRYRSLHEPSQFLLISVIVLAFLLAFLSWKFIEIPFRDRRRISRKMIIVVSFLCSTTLIGIGLVGYLNNGYFRELAGVEQTIFSANTQHDQHNQCWSLVEQYKNLSHACLLGANNPVQSFALVGDSHAASLVSELSKRALEKNLSGIDFTYSGCPLFLEGRADREVQDISGAVCYGARDDFFKKLENDELPHTLILLIRWTILSENKGFDNGEGGVEHASVVVWRAPHFEVLGDAEALKQSYKQAVSKMLKRGHRVILIYPVPEAGWDVPLQLLKLYRINHLLKPSDASTDYQVFLTRNAQTYEALDAIGEHQNLIRIKPEKIFCNTGVQNRCMTHLEEFSFYYDSNHLSNVGARLMVDEVMKRIELAF